MPISQVFPLDKEQRILGFWGAQGGWHRVGVPPRQQPPHSAKEISGHPIIWAEFWGARTAPQPLGAGAGVGGGSAPGAGVRGGCRPPPELCPVPRARTAMLTPPPKKKKNGGRGDNVGTLRPPGCSELREQREKSDIFGDPRERGPSFSKTKQRPQRGHPRLGEPRGAGPDPPLAAGVVGGKEEGDKNKMGTTPERGGKEGGTRI